MYTVNDTYCYYYNVNVSSEETANTVQTRKLCQSRTGRQHESTGKIELQIYKLILSTGGSSTQFIYTPAAENKQNEPYLLYSLKRRFVVYSGRLNWPQMCTPPPLD